MASDGPPKKISVPSGILDPFYCWDQSIRADLQRQNLAQQIERKTQRSASMDEIAVLVEQEREAASASAVFASAAIVPQLTLNVQRAKQEVASPASVASARLLRSPRAGSGVGG